MIPPDIAKIIVLRKKKHRASFFFCRALRIKSQVKQYFISLIFAHSQKNKFQLIKSLISPRYNLFELPHKNIFAFFEISPQRKREREPRLYERAFLIKLLSFLCFEYKQL